MAHVSHKLSGSLQGALAGGGDPATSPLYVFGPFLRLLVGAGAATVTFGASIWLAVLTVVTVSAMYRLVMQWVTDGSGGSGLNEEEFGPWAVKLNASITVIEYTLTFLVSVAALVTFATDRFPVLNARALGLPIRTLVAIALSVATGVAVNRGPKVAARTFGPATFAVLLLLWALIVATVWQRGLRLPKLYAAAFSPRYVGVTLGGYARILALMTGVEVFANLVAAYSGPSRERSRKAFGSLVIVMGTTSLTMLVVGPAIQELSNPLDPHVSVFTQTMDRLLPAPFAYLGTLVGIAVLLSAAAASAQGLQNLALGLRYRHYIPAPLGQRNRFEVADRPVWLEVAVCVLCFATFGTAEETYLSLYAAGVFVLLSLTGWAAVKRLRREFRRARSGTGAVSLLGAVVGALLTSGATVVIFADRFSEGAWAYCLLIPALYAAFGRARRRLGAPSGVQDRLGRTIAAGPARAATEVAAPMQSLLLPLDGTPDAERGVAVIETLASAYDARITLLSVVARDGKGWNAAEAREYLGHVADGLRGSHPEVVVDVRPGVPWEQIRELATSGNIDAIVMTTHGRARWQAWWDSSVTSEVIYQTTPPVIVVRPTNDWRSTRTRFARLLVALDGSEVSEQSLPYVHELAARFGSRVQLLAVAEGPDSDVLSGTLDRYLARVSADLAARGVSVFRQLDSGEPAQAILRAAQTERIDGILLVSHGHGGVARQASVKLGSVAARVIQEAPCPVFLVSATATKSNGEGARAVGAPGDPQARQPSP